MIAKWLVYTIDSVAVICSDTGHRFTFILYLEAAVRIEKIPSFAQSEIFNISVSYSLVYAVSGLRHAAIRLLTPSLAFCSAFYMKLKQKKLLVHFCTC